MPLLAVLRTDLKYSVRTLGASPMFTLTAVVSIALGTGANAAIFFFLHAALWKPVSAPSELYHLDRTDEVAQEHVMRQYPTANCSPRGSAGTRKFSVNGIDFL
jgi:hypothetical protein